MAETLPSAAGNPVLAAKTVWSSTKFRAACYAALTTVFSVFITGFLTALIPKLGAEQVAGIMQWVATIVGGTFGTAIAGSAYVDGQYQVANGSVASQEAIKKAQEATAVVQQSVARAQDAVSKSQAAATTAQEAVAPNPPSRPS